MNDQFVTWMEAACGKANDTRTLLTAVREHDFVGFGSFRMLSLHNCMNAYRNAQPDRMDAFEHGSTIAQGVQAPRIEPGTGSNIVKANLRDIRDEAEQRLHGTPAKFAYIRVMRRMLDLPRNTDWTSRKFKKYLVDDGMDVSSMYHFREVSNESGNDSYCHFEPFLCRVGTTDRYTLNTTYCEVWDAMSDDVKDKLHRDANDERKRRGLKTRRRRRRHRPSPDAATAPTPSSSDRDDSNAYDQINDDESAEMSHASAVATSTQRHRRRVKNRGASFVSDSQSNDESDEGSRGGSAAASSSRQCRPLTGTASGYATIDTPQKIVEASLMTSPKRSAMAPRARLMTPNPKEPCKRSASNDFRSASSTAKRRKMHDTASAASRDDIDDCCATSENARRTSSRRRGTSVTYTISCSDDDASDDDTAWKPDPCAASESSEEEDGGWLFGRQ